MAGVGIRGGGGVDAALGVGCSIAADATPPPGSEVAAVFATVALALAASAVFRSTAPSAMAGAKEDAANRDGSSAPIDAAAPVELAATAAVPEARALRSIGGLDAKVVAPGAGAGIMGVGIMGEGVTAAA